MRAKKSLGQHFLKSERALNAIIEASNLKDSDTVLEIGPGLGALTEKLLETGARVIAVEKDDQLFELLKQKYDKEISEGKLTLIHDDILQYDLSKVVSDKYKLVANIPYNITGAVFKKFLESNNQPETIVLLVQKEVAERIMARPNHNRVINKESILSISVKAYGVPQYVEKVLAGSFAPAPKVDSAIIAVRNISKQFFQSDERQISEKTFFEMLNAGFKSKRKKLSSNLSVIFEKNKVSETFKKLNLDDNLRAEVVDIDTWRKISLSLLVP